MTTYGLGSIDRLPSGKYRARDACRRNIGTFDTFEQARSAANSSVASKRLQARAKRDAIAALKRVARYEAMIAKKFEYELTDEERFALNLLRPIDSTHDSIGQSLRMSRANVQRIERIAMAKMLAAAQRAGLESLP